MAQLADRLAIAVGRQWNTEVAVRRLNDPYPLPVSWAAADPSLTDAWDVLVKLATSGAGWPLPPPTGTWAAEPGELAGMGGDLVRVLAQVPTGRLVVLGEPGAGKTMLMVRLVLDLLARRAEGGPVPVLASVASWNPASHDLWDWLAAWLLIDHPALADSPPDSTTESTQAAALLASGLILPVLDGLDEIPEQVRGPALNRINDALRPGGQVVVTCRSKEYRAAIRPPGGAEVTLRAAVVQLRPLDANAVRGYLCDDVAGPVARARWDPVLAALGSQAPVGEALATPLMAGLARAIYNPRPGEYAGDLRDPAELCSSALTDRSAVEALLFDAFIPAAYRPPTAGRWTARQAETWLIFLARHLERKIASPDLAWWQLRQAVPRTTVGLGFGLLGVLAAGLVAGLFSGLMARLGFGLLSGLGFGLVAGLAVGLVAGSGRRNTEAPSRGMRISVSRLGFMLALALVAGLSAGGRFGLLSGLGFGPALGLAAGLVAVPGDPATAASPQAVLARDQRAALLLMLVAGLAVGLGFGLVAGLAGGLRFGLAVGLAVGLVAGLFVSWTRTAWPSYMLTIGWLAFHHRLAWSLMSFLADAHQRGVLRQAGAVYQFRHTDLQHRLASRP